VQCWGNHSSLYNRVVKAWTLLAALFLLSQPVMAGGAPAGPGDAVEVAVVAVAEEEPATADCSCDSACACCVCEPQCGAGAGCPAAEPWFYGPLAVPNQHPTFAPFLSPVPDTAGVLDDGEARLSFRLDLTNNIIRELDNGIIVDLDFETLRGTFDYRQGAGGGEFSLRVPLVSRTHGFLDGVISDWHRLFGLPNGLRDNFPDNQYRFTIVTRQGPVYNESGDTFGVGDVLLGYKRPVWRRGGEALSWRAGVKLPTGDADSALGSGGMDFQLGGLYQQQFGEHLRGYVNLDYIFTGEPEWDNIGHQDVLATLWALEYGASPDTTVVMQYQTQRNPLRIGSREADKDGQELGIGFHHRIGGGLVWSGGFVEDLYPETGPDFVVFSHFGWEI